MYSSSSKVQQFLLHAALPILCSVLIGFAFFHGEVFDRYRPTFQFVWSAVVASLFYNLLISVRSRDAWLGLVMLLFFTFVTTHSTRPTYLMRDVWYVAGIAAAILVYTGYFKQGGSLTPVVGPLVLAGLFAFCNMISSLAHFLIVSAFSDKFASYSILPLARNTAYYGAMIGFGVGVGITLADKLFGQTVGPADILWPPKHAAEPQS